MTNVKICGITNIDDAIVSVQAGADLLGFIFYEPSPRYVDPGVVKKIISEIKAHVASTANLEMPQFVGVFVNTPQREVSHILELCQLDRAQFHGEEAPEFVAAFPEQGFKAMRPQSQTEADRLIDAYLPTTLATVPPFFLFDAYHPTLYGGTGRVTDWTMAAKIAQNYPIMLAGSLTATNVGEAIRAVRPWGVDVSSGGRG